MTRGEPYACGYNRPMPDFLSPKSESENIQVVDLVRCVSILLVLFGHQRYLFIHHPTSSPWLEQVYYRVWLNHGFGVTAFFVVSGFLITRVIAAGPGGLFKPNFRGFYARRVGRLFPLLATVSLLTLILIHALSPLQPRFEDCLWNPARPPDWLWGFSILTFTVNWVKCLHFHPEINYGQTWSVLWSLSIEEQFYLFYPLALKKLGNERNLFIFLAAVVLFEPISYALAFHFFPYDQSLYYSSFVSFGQIALGCLLYLVSQRAAGFLEGRLLRSVSLCLLGMVIGFIFYQHVYVRSDEGWFEVGSLFIGLAVFLFLLGGMNLSFFKKRFWRFLVLPGKLSYGMYLLHPVLLYFLSPFMENRDEFLAFVLFASVTTAVAFVSYRFFEAPANRLVRRLIEKSA